ncbi:MAG TPA: hypothetical protein VII44_10400 [Puia sp.]
MYAKIDLIEDKLVSRQQEIELYCHNFWQLFWGNDFYTTRLRRIYPSDPEIALNYVQKTEDKVKTASVKSSTDDQHLHSLRVVTGFHIRPVDSDIGHQIDFIMDDQPLKIRYLAIETHQWIGGQKVLLPFRNIKGIQWENASVYVDDSIKTSPSFDRSVCEDPETMNIGDYKRTLNWISLVCIQ